MFKRLAALFAALSYPLLFALGYSAWRFVERGDPRFLMELVGEAIATTVWMVVAIETLRWLSVRRETYPIYGADAFVIGMSLIYVLFIAIDVLNPATSGLLAKGGRLQFYFANAWYRRMVTFTTVPSLVATYHAIFGLLSPAHRRRRILYLGSIALLLAESLLGGSKGAAILTIITASAFVFPLVRVRTAKLLLVVGGATVGYVTLFLAFSANKAESVLAIVRRFFLSIDMSILLRGRGTASILAGKLNDVWLEVFRNTSAFGVRVAPEPIGSLIYHYTFGTPASTGANVRYGSLMLLYPHRIDFLIGYPVLVCFVAWLLYEAMCTMKWEWSARIALPVFIADAFQDVYWFASHVLPILFGGAALLMIVRATRYAADRNCANSGKDRDGSPTGLAGSRTTG